MKLLGWMIYGYIVGIFMLVAFPQYQLLSMLTFGFFVMLGSADMIGTSLLRR